MSALSSRDHSRSPPPKRKRSHDESSYATPTFDTSADFQYAYDEDLPSDLHTPAADDDDAVGTPSSTTPPPPKRLRLERPTTLLYIPSMTLHGHKKGISQAKFSPNGTLLASCSADATIKIWNATTGQLIHTLEGHLAGVSCIAWSPDSKVLASGSDDKMIRLWDMSTGKCLPNALVGHHNYVYSIAFSPKGNMLVSGSYDEAVFLWDVRTARIMRSLPAHSDPVSGVDFVRDGTLVVSCSSDGLIRIWDTTTGQCLKTLVHEDNAHVSSVRFSPNGKYVLAATLDSCVRLWNHVDGRVVKTFQGHRNERFSINTVFGEYAAEVDDEDEEIMAAVREEYGDAGPPKWAFAGCGSEDGDVLLWDVNSKEVLQRFRAHEGVVLGLDIRNNDQAMATCGIDRTIRIWKRAPFSRGANGHGDENGHRTPENGAVGAPPEGEKGSTTHDAQNGVFDEPMPDVSASGTPDIAPS